MNGSMQPFSNTERCNEERLHTAIHCGTLCMKCAGYLTYACQGTVGHDGALQKSLHPARILFLAAAFWAERQRGGNSPQEGRCQRLLAG